jgi:hypothetical protein
MKQKKFLIALILLAALFLAAGAAYAQSAGFDLRWWTVDGGGGESQGEGYTLAGTVGQPDAGQMIGDGYQLTGGLWSGAAQEPAAQNSLFLPLVTR